MPTGRNAGKHRGSRRPHAAGHWRWMNQSRRGTSAADPGPRSLVAGFWLWEVKDLDEAVAWGKCCPNTMPGPSEIEIRRLYEMADLQPESDTGGRANS